ncbi:PREDICTED: beta-1,4-galactosyltransferase 5 [Bison bison bison]|nr:PREDICTED: beta-1,4-galactosyltransferase 5 [Bison bison bison]
MLGWPHRLNAVLETRPGNPPAAGPPAGLQQRQGQQRLRVWRLQRLLRWPRGAPRQALSSSEPGLAHTGCSVRLWAGGLSLAVFSYPSDIQLFLGEEARVWQLLDLDSRKPLPDSCLFPISKSACMLSTGLLNTYLFMMQAQGILIRDNMRTIGAQVYEQVVRSAYAKRNSSVNDSDYPLDLNHSESFLQTTTFLPEDFTYFANHTCPERLPSMKGPIDINMSEIGMDAIHELFSKDPTIKLGGHWKPSDCVPRWKVAILVPFRNRHEHLPVLLRHLIPMLQRQRLRFAFYVVEQVGTQPFNRAMLFNVGFQEAMKDLDWDCLIFHDVDHIPESDRNYYGCGQMPRHFATKLDKYMYLLPYTEFFGGVSGLTVEQFRKINGFPNAFWGWGGEDDDLWNRVQNAGYSVSRPEGDTGKYKSIPHHHRGEVQFLGRYALLRKSKERQAVDGLNNLNYFANVTYDALYKNITVNLTPELAQVTEY